MSEGLAYLELEKDDVSEEDAIERVTVPDIRGMSISDAKNVLKDLDLSLELKTNQEITGEETIKNQAPMPGFEVNAGSKLYYEI